MQPADFPVPASPTDPLGQHAARSPEQGDAARRHVLRQDVARGGTDGHVDVWCLVRRALAGRFRLAVIFAAVGAVGGAAGGITFGRSLYRSEGVVRIAGVVPEVFESTDQNRLLPMLDAYLQSQQIVIGSRRIVEMTLNDPEWRATGRGDTPEVVRDFIGRVKVEVKPRTDCIRVSFTDEDPHVAAAAVNSLIRAYARAYRAQQSELQQDRVKVLESRRDAIAEKLHVARAEIQVIVQETGAGFEPLYYATMQHVLELESAVSDINRALAAIPGEAADATPWYADPAPELSPERIAMVDDVMRGHLNERTKRQTELRLQRLHHGEAHPLVVRLRTLLETVEEQVRRYGQEYRAFKMGTEAAGQAVGGRSAVAGKSARELADEQERLAALHAQAKEKLLALGQKRMRVEQLKTDAERYHRELADVDRRIRVLEDEEALGGRLGVLSSGDVPLAPAIDTRMRAGAVGAAGGMLVPLSALVLLGWLDPRYRSCRLAAADLAGQIPLFGLLPALPTDRFEACWSTMAAQCVHHTRLRLHQSRASGDGPMVLLVTSPSGGEGRTSLTLALGMSFAASGSRTLVIDADFVGRGLSRALGAADVGGLHEALASGSLGQWVKRTRTGLFVLPAGAVTPAHACMLHPESVRQLLAEARAQFDVVLIDSGPMLGGVEASVFAREAGNVLLVVAQGQSQSSVWRSMQQLGELGAKVAGVVFNRTSRGDFCSAVGVSRRRLTDANRPGVTSPAATEPLACGPVVTSVLRSLGLTRREDLELYTEDAELWILQDSASQTSTEPHGDLAPVPESGLPPKRTEAA